MKLVRIIKRLAPASWRAVTPQLMGRAIRQHTPGGAMKRHSRLLTLVALGMALACSRSLTEVELRERLDEIHAAIVALIGDPLCESVAECRYIAYGEQACGGPSTHLVYSIAQTDSLQLTMLVDEHRRLKREWNAKTGAISTCGLPNIPVLGRRDGRCVDLNQMSELPGR